MLQIHVIYVIIAAILIIVFRGMRKEHLRIRNIEKNEDTRFKQALDKVSELKENDFRRLQDWVGDWSDRVLKPKGVTIQGTYKHLQKEMVELGKELDIWLSPAFQVKPDMSYLEVREKMAKEIADIVIVCCHLSHQLNIPLSSHILEKMEINEKRQWAEANAEGVSQHISENV